MSEPRFGIEEGGTEYMPLFHLRDAETGEVWAVLPHRASADVWTKRLNNLVDGYRQEIEQLKAQVVELRDLHCLTEGRTA